MKMIIKIVLLGSLICVHCVASAEPLFAAVGCVKEAFGLLGVDSTFRPRTEGLHQFVLNRLRVIGDRGAVMGWLMAEADQKGIKLYMQYSSGVLNLTWRSEDDGFLHSFVMNIKFDKNGRANQVSSTVSVDGCVNKTEKPEVLLDDTNDNPLTDEMGAKKKSEGTPAKGLKK